MIGRTISHYSALWNPAHWRNPGKRDEILEKLGGGKTAYPFTPTHLGRIST